jgi:hypothetical protein
MLEYTEKIEPATSDVTITRGRDISHANLSKRERSQLAIEVIEGRAIITNLTKTQIARLFGVPADCIRTHHNILEKRRRTASRRPWCRPVPPSVFEAARDFGPSAFRPDDRPIDLKRHPDRWLRGYASEACDTKKRSQHDGDTHEYHL